MSCNPQDCKIFPPVRLQSNGLSACKLLQCRRAIGLATHFQMSKTRLRMQTQERASASYEKKKSNESYQIKVQYGRFLLERAIYEKDERTPYSTLKKANMEWKTVLLNNEAQKFYVYKQMYLYPSYIEVYGGQFTEKEYNNTVKMLENMSMTIRKTAYSKHHLKEREQAIKHLEKAQKGLLKTVIKG